MVKLPEKLGTAKQRRERAEKAKKLRDSARSMLQTAYDYCCPENNTFNDRERHKEENIHLYDETAPHSLTMFANNMQGSLVPAEQKWMKLTPGDEIPEEAKDQAEAILSPMTDTFFKYLHQTNFDTAVNPFFRDVGISTGWFQFQDLPPVYSEIGYWQAIPADEICPEESPRGKLDNLHRFKKVEARHIKETWPDASLPDKLEKIIAKDGHAKVEILISQLEYERSYYHVVMWEEHDLLVQQFGAKRIIGAGMTLASGEVYRRGPALYVLPAIRRLNKIQEFGLKAGAFAIAPPIMTTDAGAFNPWNSRLRPGAPINVKSNDNANPTLRTLQIGADFNWESMKTEELQEVIRKAFFVDPIGDIDDPTRTLGEIQIRMQEFLKNQGASISRLKSEFVNEAVDTFLDAMAIRGKIEPEIRLDGKIISIRHESPLAQAEQLEDFQNTQTFLRALGEIAQTLPPEAAAGFLAGTVNIEKVPSEIAKMLGVDPAILRTEAEQRQLAQQYRGAIENGALQ